MPDIFISYSRKDSEQALQLANRLRDEGMDVWIDQHGIDAATSWSNEIVQALDAAKAMLVLLSPASIQSDNVVRELSLAFEAKKPILPVVLEPVTLPTQFRYQLAGIQRAHLADYDAILRALRNLGIRDNVSTHTPEALDSAIRLAVLPFDDLSPAKDNEWFADGLMEELIHTLGSLGRLHVNPKGDVVYYKKNRPKLSELASDLKCRYIVEGGVQKSGEQIRIRVSLSDALEHKQLWSEKYDGTFDNIFDFQERTATSIAEALSLRLTPEEELTVRRTLTENPEAYECYWKGNQYFQRQTKSDCERALALFEDAVRLDPRFASAYANIALAYGALYRTYSHQVGYLKEADAAVARVLEIEGETPTYFWIASRTAMIRGNSEAALRFAKRSVELDANYALGYDALAFAYQALGDVPQQVRAMEHYVRLHRNDTDAHFGLLTALDEHHDPTLLHDAAERALPVFERYVRLNPDDDTTRVNYGLVLYYAGRISESLELTRSLAEIASLQGVALYNLACINLRCQNVETGMELLLRSVAGGFSDLDSLRLDPDLDAIRQREEFRELVKAIQEKQNG